VIFWVSIKYDRRNIRLFVERIEATKTIEKYKVVAKNQSFILQNNRPLIKSKGLKYFPITWKVISGGYHHSFVLEQLYKAIETKIKE
jgi:hypothetical protein